MRRFWLNLNQIQRKKRQLEPLYVDNCIVNGCLPKDDFSEQILEALQANAVSFDTLWESGDMPILKYDETFKKWRNDQIQDNETLVKERITCTLPWQVLKHIDVERKESERLYWSQGGRPSCMGHADAFAFHSSVLHLIARGAPLKYCPINPLVTWAITKGDSLRGGQTVSEMANGSNSVGHFIESQVGTNNQSLPSYREHLENAKRFQAAIMFMDFEGNELCEEIFACCAAGLSVAFGNSHAVSGSKIDKNGVKIAVLRGTWYHATHFTAYRTVNGTEYIGWVNSHGPQYNSSDEGEPSDICWMDKKTACRFCSSMPRYGSPYVVFPESVSVRDRSLFVTNQIPWPENWRF